MIFILAATYSHAKKWAASQMLANDEWFCSLDESDIHGRENFHVVVLESASELPPPQFERIFNLAQRRGRMNRR